MQSYDVTVCLLYVVYRYGCAWVAQTGIWDLIRDFISNDSVDCTINTLLNSLTQVTFTH